MLQVPRGSNPNSGKPSWSVDKCVQVAARYIHKNGVAWLMFDVIDSCNEQKHPSATFTKELLKMTRHLNRKFKAYMPINQLRGLHPEWGFVCYRGDIGTCGVNNIDGIREIIEYQAKKFPNFQLRWIVAESCYDPISKKI